MFNIDDLDEIFDADDGFAEIATLTHQGRVSKVPVIFDAADDEVFGNTQTTEYKIFYTSKVSIEEGDILKIRGKRYRAKVPKATGDSATIECRLAEIK